MSPLQQTTVEHTASMKIDERQSTAAMPTLAQRVWSPVLYLGITLVALLTRVLNLDLFLDSDEINFWIGRSHDFWEAVQSGRFADTAISTHPGVTTMWLGSAGIVLRQSLRASGILASTPFPVLLMLMRLPAAITHTIGIVVGYALLRRIFPLQLATLAALLWAADPFVIAYQRILHVDGLTTTFATLSILAACVYWHHDSHPGMLVLSAVCGGLAVLSKSPGLAVVPVIILVAISHQLSAMAMSRPPSAVRDWLTTLYTPFLTLSAWLLVFAITIILVWPAVWADPGRVYHLLRVGVEVEGGSPHVIGNFFLGQEVDTPDWRYYLVALALRTTPISLLGLVLLPLLWRRAGVLSPPLLAASSPRHPAASPPYRDLAVLAGFVLLFVVAMSMFPKKLNRYIVPTFPALDILSAAGWVYALCALRFTPGRSLVRGLLPLIAVIAIVNAGWWHPYGVVAFNQLLGGTPAGIRTFLIGDGEGLGEAARWLNQQPDITGVTVASTMINSLQPWLRPGAQSVSPRRGQLSPETGYALIYIRHLQRGTLPPPFDQFYPHQNPLHRVTIHGVDFALIYQVPPPIAHQLDVRFGDNLVLAGYAVDTVDTSAVQSTGVLSLTVQWRSDAAVGENDTMFAHILDANGARIGQIDVPLNSTNAPTGSWQPGRYVTWVSPIPLSTSAQAPVSDVAQELGSGSAWLAIGVYDARTFVRLPVQASIPPGAPDAGGNALLIPLRIHEQ